MTDKSQPADVAQKIVDAGSAGLWKQADALLTARLKNNPQDILALQRLALSLRQRGDLFAAADMYNKLADIYPDDRVSNFLAKVCKGTIPDIDFDDDEMRPAPFLVKDNFLPASARTQLIELLKQYQNELQPLGVTFNSDRHGGTDYIVDREQRHQLGLFRTHELRTILLPVIEKAMTEFLDAFGLEPFKVKGHGLRLDVMPDGGHGRMHQDIILDGVRLSYIYYFNELPKAFTGGDFLLFDQKTSTDEPSADHFTMIRHEDNRLVVFLPRNFHKPTRVDAIVPEPALLDSRLSVSGFVFEDG